MSRNKVVVDVLSAYKYTQNKPYFTLDNLSCYEAEHKDSSLKFTIKIIKRVDPDLVQYLRKIKSNNSQYTIKIVEFIHTNQKGELIIVQEAATYGTLKNALLKCKRLDDDDCITVSKLLLNGHIQLLRQGIYWYGDQNDIQITQNGVKLSWNNTFPFSENNENPFPRILENIGLRKSSSSILEFPKNKMLDDLIKVSRENASQMSLHPLLKKREKVFKKKGKQWIGLKENKVKGQYVQELNYLAVSKEFGFVRVKVFEKGTLDGQIVKIHQTNPSFIKILNYYDENSNWVTVSQYSNDGTVQNYVKRLKNANTQLKENQIQFFFYSLMEPLKFVNKSPVGSLNFLHIKNIYIHDGIVKIGEPLPMTELLKEILKQKAEIPDFYHTDFKANPQSKRPEYDTYSLGIFIHKLMYTEYPIFPNGTFSMPTAPSYKSKLTGALKLFLTEKSSLQELQQKIEVSEDVKAQVKSNEKALEQAIGGKQVKQVSYRVDQYSKANEIHSEVSLHEDEQHMQETKTKGRCGKLCGFLSKRGLDKHRKYENLHKSNFSSYRQCTASVLVLSLYFFAFFFIYMEGLYNLLAHTRLFSKVDVSILGQTHTVIVPDYNEFLLSYDKYNNTNSVSVLRDEMMCVIDNKNIYYDFIRPTSPHWYIYLLFSLGLMFLILLAKGIQVCYFSTTAVGYHYYDRTIDGSNTSKFAISSYVIFQLWFGMTLWAFYYLFNIIFNEQHSPCFGGDDWTMLTQSLLTDRMEFTSNYFIILLAVFVFCLLSFLQVTVFFTRINYDQLCNPIFILAPFYLGLLVALRVGAFDKFQPSWAHNENKIIGNGYMNTIGYFPEILIVVEVLVCLLVDLMFDKCMDKKIERLLLSENSFRLDPEAEVEALEKESS